MRAQHVARAATWLPLAGVLLLALGLRINALGFQSLTDDEGYSVGLAQRSFGDMLGLFHWEGNGTIYSVVLWPLVRVSDSLDMLRLPAALAGVAAVGATYWAGRELATRRVALIGALLLAVSPMAVRYAQFARPFSFVLLFGALSMALLARHVRTGGNGWLAGYSAVLALAAYSNSLAPILLVPVHLALVAPAGRAAVRRLVVAVGGAALLASPVITLAILETGRRDPLYWLTRPGIRRVAEVTEEFMVGRASNELVTVRVAAVLGLLVSAALILAHIGARRGRERRFGPLVIWAALPLAIAFAISMARPVFFGAYLIVVLPGLCLLLASGAARLSPRLATGLLGLLILAWGWSSLAMERPPAFDDHRAATAFITAQRPALDPLIIDPITTLPGFGYYDASLRAPDGKIVVKEWGDEPMPPGVTGVTDPGGYGDAPPGPPSAALVSRLAQRTGRVVLVIDSTFRQGDVEHGTAAGWMRGHCTVASGDFGGIVVLAARACRTTAR